MWKSLFYGQKKHSVWTFPTFLSETIAGFPIKKGDQVGCNAKNYPGVRVDDSYCIWQIIWHDMYFCQDAYKVVLHMEITLSIF